MFDGRPKKLLDELVSTSAAPRKHSSNPNQSYTNRKILVLQIRPQLFTWEGLSEA